MKKWLVCAGALTFGLGVLLQAPAQASPWKDDYTKCRAAYDAADYGTASVYCVAAAEDFADEAANAKGGQHWIDVYREADGLTLSAWAFSHMDEPERAAHIADSAYRLFNEIIAADGADADTKAYSKKYLAQFHGMTGYH